MWVAHCHHRSLRKEQAEKLGLNYGSVLVFVKQNDTKLASEICDNAVKALTDFQGQCHLVAVFDESLAALGFRELNGKIHQHRQGGSYLPSLHPRVNCSTLATARNIEGHVEGVLVE